MLSCMMVVKWLCACVWAQVIKNCVDILNVLFEVISAVLTVIKLVLLESILTVFCSLRVS